MTDQDRKASRREIADALLKALERRHEIADVVVESETKTAALEAVAALLETSHAAAEAVMGMSFDMLTKDSRKKILAELEDLNKQLSFTVGERPASSGETLELRPFSATEDRDIFASCGSIGPAGIAAPPGTPAPGDSCGSTAEPGNRAAAAATRSPTTAPANGWHTGVRPASADARRPVTLVPPPGSRLV